MSRPKHIEPATADAYSQQQKDCSCAHTPLTVCRVPLCYMKKAVRKNRLLHEEHFSADKEPPSHFTPERPSQSYIT